MPLISGAKVLDLFAGTGALGFEAASRGAEHVRLVEQDQELVALLEQNQQTLAAEALSVIHTDALLYLSQSNDVYDLIFLDPPFEQGLISRACDAIKQHHLLSSNGYLYIESEKTLSLPDYLVVHKQKTTGQVQYGLYTLNDE